MGNNKIIGAKIKSIRESKQLSTQEVSERSGLSIEQIERIEGNIDFPSLAPLIKIARVLGVRLGTFLDDQAELGPVALGAVRLQHAHDLQLPAAGFFGRAFAGPDGQGHLILVDVHKGRQLLAVGIGLALPALARVLKLIPGGPADQNL